MYEYLFLLYAGSTVPDLRTHTEGLEREKLGLKSAMQCAGGIDPPFRLKPINQSINPELYCQGVFVFPFPIPDFETVGA